LKQLTYKGHRTVRLKLMDLVDSGQIEEYDNYELAELLDCTPRTIEAYLRDYNRSIKEYRTLEVGEYELPLRTTIGVKSYHHKGCDDCRKCEMEEVCRREVAAGNFVACELPLAKEVWGEEEEEERD